MESELESAVENTLIEDLKLLRGLMDQQNKIKNDIEDLKGIVMEKIKKEHPQGIELPRDFGTYKRVEVAVSQRSAYTCEATEFEVLKWGKKRNLKSRKSKLKIKISDF